jgi:hypothetical protein
MAIGSRGGQRGVIARISNRGDDAAKECRDEPGGSIGSGTHRFMERVMLGLVRGLFVMGLLSSSIVWGAEPGPATVTEAAKVLDLTMFPRLPQAKDPETATLVQLNYVAPVKVPAAFDFQKTTLTKQGWKELEGSYRTDEYAMGGFTKQGFIVSAMAYPEGDQTRVTLIQHGNVDLKKLPLPADAKSLAATPANLIMLTKGAVDETKQAFAAGLKKQGWVVYGEDPTISHYRKNAVLLTVMVSAAPAQMDQTAINIQSTMLSYVLPAPEGAMHVNYDDSQTMLHFDTQSSAEVIAQYYRDFFTKQGWEATTENLIADDNRRTLIFRNAAKEYADLEVMIYEPDSNVRVRYQTAAQFAAEEARVKAALAKAKSKPMPKTVEVALELPKEAADVEADETNVEFGVGSGKALGIVTKWLAALKKAEWKPESEELSKEAGVLVLKQGELLLTIDYIDPGFIPAKVDVRLSGGVLKVTEPE